MDGIRGATRHVRIGRQEVAELVMDLGCRCTETNGYCCRKNNRQGENPEFCYARERDNVKEPARGQDAVIAK